MSNGTLIIFSGLPASGKSTLSAMTSSALHATYLRVDTIESGLQEKQKSHEFGVKCYRVAQVIAQENLRLGNFVVADCVNPWGESRHGWNSVAKDIGAKFINVEVACSNKEEHKNRLESRTTILPGLTDPTWKEVQERDYHAWDLDRIFLDTSGKSVDQSFQELLAELQSHGVNI
jgi:predicted kinase